MHPHFPCRRRGLAPHRRSSTEPVLRRLEGLGMNSASGAGFTIIEVLLSTVILALLAGALVSFFLLTHEVNVRSEVTANVDQTGSFATDAIARKAHEAQVVAATSTVLTLTMSDASTVVIDLASGRIRLTEGGVISYLTPATMEVQNLNFVPLGQTTQTKRGVTVSFDITNTSQQNVANLLNYTQEFRTTVAGREGMTPSSSSTSSSSTSSSSSSGPSAPNEATVDSSVAGEDTEAQIQRTPIVVFTGDLIGYVFYTNDDGRCMYSRTGNGGTSWGAGAQVTAQTDCAGVVVWYDRWTPGDTTGNLIHLAFADDGNDLWYQALDTSTDTLLGSEVNISGAAQDGSLDEDNRFSITKATDGKLYAGLADDSDSFILRCSGSCENASNWSEVGSNPLDLAEDDLKLLPLASGNVLLLNWDISGNDIRSKVWNGSSWSGSWTNIGNAQDDTEYRSTWGATVKKSTNEIFLVWNDHVADSSGKIRTAIYNGTWTIKTDIATSHHGYGCDIAIDENSGDIYVARLKRIGSEQVNVLVTSSNDNMQNWSADTQVNVQTVDYEALSMNMMSTERIYSVQWDEDSFRLLGSTVRDLP